MKKILVILVMFMIMATGAVHAEIANNPEVYSEITLESGSLSENVFMSGYRTLSICFFIYGVLRLSSRNGSKIRL